MTRNILTMIGAFLGGGVLILSYQTLTKPSLVLVDVTPLIEVKARALSIQALSPHQLQQKLEGVRKDLMESLEDFAKTNNVIVASSKAVWGNLPDYSPQFEAFYQDRTES